MENDKEKRTKIVGVRLTAEEYKIIEEIAQDNDRKISEYIRLATLRYIEIKKASDKI